MLPSMYVIFIVLASWYIICLILMTDCKINKKKAKHLNHIIHTQMEANNIRVGTVTLQRWGPEF